MTCDWPIDRACLPALPVLGDTPTDEEQAAYNAALASSNAAEDLAVQVLWALSGRQFGVCPVVARPCPNRSPYSPFDRGLYGLYGSLGWDLGWDLFVWIGGGWGGIGCGCIGRCRLTGPRMVHLPSPVIDVTEVVIDGVAINSTEYVLEGNVLYRVGANWPLQDLGKPMGETGTWSVEYLHGYPPPSGTANMVGTLAKEFLAACSGGACRLPRTVTTASRNGVTYRVYDPAVIYGNGKTGIPEIDLWLAAINPAHLIQAPVVL